MSFDPNTGIIRIDEWDTGLGASSAQGFADMRSLDPFRKPGYLELSLEMLNEADTPFSYTVTNVDTATDILTVSGSILRNTTGDGSARAVTFTSSATLPAPLVAGTVYFITGATPSATTFKLSSTLALALANNSDINLTTTGSGTITCTSLNMGTPKYITYSPYFLGRYLQDANGRVWYSQGNIWLLLAGNTLTNASGNGIVVWKNFLLTFRDTAIDYYDIVAGTWTNAWKTGLTFSTDHLPFVSADDAVYFLGQFTSGGKYFVSSLIENTTFDPATAATYTYNLNALDVPTAITCFADLGLNLMIGTDSDKIYPWDRFSDSFNTPILLIEPYVQAMKTLNNVLYFSSGAKANIYKTYGTTVEKFIDVPDEYLQTFQYGAVVKKITFNSNEILFWIDGTTQSVSGLYAADLATKAMHMKYQPSRGSGVSIASGALFVLPVATNNDIVLVGYVSGGITYLDSNKAFGTTQWTETRYGAYCITPAYEVASFDNSRTFQKIQILLGKPFTTGQGVRISSRTDLTSAFANAVTFDFSSTGATAVADEAGANIETSRIVQFKIEVTSGASAPTFDLTNYLTPTLKSVLIS
jgi:hypothetical protein